jgi:hypothetical protein
MSKNEPNGCGCKSIPLSVILLFMGGGNMREFLTFHQIFAGAGFYPVPNFHQKHNINPPCLIDDEQNL